jgi:hypothetical protein
MSTYIGDVNLRDRTLARISHSVGSWSGMFPRKRGLMLFHGERADQESGEGASKARGEDLDLSEHGLSALEDLFGQTTPLADGVGARGPHILSRYMAARFAVAAAKTCW